MSLVGARRGALDVCRWSLVEVNQANISFEEEVRGKGEKGDSFREKVGGKGEKSESLREEVV